MKKGGFWGFFDGRPRRATGFLGAVRFLDAGAFAGARLRVVLLAVDLRGVSPMMSFAEPIDGMSLSLTDGLSLLIVYSV
ncbi:hypothetical protein THIOSC13_510008 [uncultured Thiomicrorhabdus sp.]